MNTSQSNPALTKDHTKSPVTEEKRLSLTKDDILGFLSQNPAFLQENPDVIDALLPPKTPKKKGEVANFQSYLIERLKADKQEVINNTRTLVENARSNMNNQQRIHKAVLRLLESRSLNEFIQCITMDLASMLDVDISVLIVECDDAQIPHIDQKGLRILPPGTVAGWMQDKTIMLQDDISGIEAIYGGGATLVRSQMLLRIDISEDTPPAILAFGSREPDMFKDGQATDQIAFLARVVERAFRLLLNT
ncbi:MAG: DUF484 family protein [Alphaproteobacteria bacterium]